MAEYSSPHHREPGFEYGQGGFGDALKAGVHILHGADTPQGGGYVQLGGLGPQSVGMVGMKEKSRITAVDKQQ